MHRIALALTLLSGTPAAQEPKSVRQILDGLESGDPPRIAQAAFDAGEQELEKAIPGLQEALKDLAKMDHNTALHPRAAVLDALVRLGGRAEAKDLELCLDKYLLPAAVILMSRAPADYEDQLIQVFENFADKRTQYCWLAAGNLLTGMRSKKFARQLLDRMQVIVNVSVIRPGDEIQRPNRTFVGGAGAGSTQYLYHRKSPPFGLYELDSRKREGDLLVTQGPVPVFGRRLLPEKARKRIRLRSSWSNVDFTTRNLEWIAQLLDTEVKKLPMSSNLIDTIFFSNNRSYARDIQRIRDKVRGSHAALANRLRVAGFIPTDKKIRADVNVRMFVSDYRPKGAVELPEIESVKVYPRRETKK